MSVLTIFKNIRLKTFDIQIGKLTLGSNHPVRVQSMANTPTHNVEASVKQAIEIIEAGGELVRFTVIDSKDAEALNDIKISLTKKGYNTPLVADVHFNPALADIAAKYVDKVRINPGNYIDKRATFTEVEYTDKEYSEELQHLEERFVRFLNICKEHNTAIRIGTNHGSLSDRIMSRYGDTPEGMVEATMEFLRICKKHNFVNVVVSMKSSNTVVMVHAYRLLTVKMIEEQMQYALHLGVTEAGNGQDGRIKSAVGIGTLMHDGLGDTIRVSLTENPAKEIPVAKTIVDHIDKFRNTVIKTTNIVPDNLFEFKKYNTEPLFDKPIVIADISNEERITENILTELNFNKTDNIAIPSDNSPDVIYTGVKNIEYLFDKGVMLLTDYKNSNNNISKSLFSVQDYIEKENTISSQHWIHLSLPQLTTDVIEKLKQDSSAVIVAFSNHKNYVQEIRALIYTLRHYKINRPIVVQLQYEEPDNEQFQIKASADAGLFFIDGLANGLWLKNSAKDCYKIVNDTAFGILQAGRRRITKTEYISCPGCGRTLFDLEQTLEEVKQSTSHLKGLKIAVMGCIVNGPGEMADADYGYVGAGPGKVSLYKGKEVIKRNINTKDAVKVLLDIINTNIY